jgi:hypothetical protein
MDVSGLIRKGKFGGIDLFDSMLEEQVGYMDATDLRGMYAEHCMDAASSNTSFSPPNNPSLVCTPERGFYSVVGDRCAHPAWPRPAAPRARAGAG